MTPELIALFKSGEALALYEVIEEHILDLFPDTKISVKKTQVSFSCRYGFAYAWPPVRRFKGAPKLYVGLTFGLPCRVEDPRIVSWVEAYPGRFTHHVVIATPEDLDGQVEDWIKQSHAFSMAK